MDWAKADQLVEDLAWLDEHGALGGVTAIIAERRRQIGLLGHDAEHDRTAHPDGGLVRMARAKLAQRAPGPSPVRELRQAGALLAAEIDRLGGGAEA